MCLFSPKKGRKEIEAWTDATRLKENAIFRISFNAAEKFKSQFQGFQKKAMQNQRNNRIALSCHFFANPLIDVALKSHLQITRLQPNAFEWLERRTKKQSRFTTGGAKLSPIAHSNGDLDANEKWRD